MEASHLEAMAGTPESSSGPSRTSHTLADTSRGHQRPAQPSEDLLSGELTCPLSTSLTPERPLGKEEGKKGPLEKFEKISTEKALNFELIEFKRLPPKE